MLAMREPSNITSSPDHTLSTGMQNSGPELVSYPDPSLLFCSLLCVCKERKQAEGKLQRPYIPVQRLLQLAEGVRCHKQSKCHVDAVQVTVVSLSVLRDIAEVCPER